VVGVVVSNANYSQRPKAQRDRVSRPPIGDCARPRLDLARRLRRPQGAGSTTAKAAELVAWVANSSPFADHSTLQPTRELTHTTAAIQGSAKHTPRLQACEKCRHRQKLSVAASTRTTGGTTGRCRIAGPIASSADALESPRSDIRCTPECTKSSHQEPSGSSISSWCNGTETGCLRG
jgi:hypothetical protein